MRKRKKENMKQTGVPLEDVNHQLLKFNGLDFKISY